MNISSAGSTSSSNECCFFVFKHVLLNIDPCWEHFFAAGAETLHCTNSQQLCSFVPSPQDIGPTCCRNRHHLIFHSLSDSIIEFHICGGFEVIVLSSGLMHSACVMRLWQWGLLEHQCLQCWAEFCIFRMLCQVPRTCTSNLPIDQALCWHFELGIDQGPCRKGQMFCAMCCTFSTE